MDDAVLFPDTMLATGSDDAVELGFIDELLADDIWLGIHESASYLLQGATTYPKAADSSHQFYPISEIEKRFSIPSPETHTNISSIERPSPSGYLPRVDEPIEVNVSTLPNICSRYFVRHQEQDDEPGKKNGSTSYSIQLRAFPDPISSLKERVARILSSVEEYYRGFDMLIQTWVPMNSGNRQVLTTYGQPFLLSPNCQRLMNYRTISAGYQFSTEQDSNNALGLPGRVFLGKLPEWSPDVRYFKNYEYVRVSYAKRYDVRGSLAIPIFEHGNSICLGVMEVVMTTERINCSSDLECICNALKAVDLDGSHTLTIPHVKMKIDLYLSALPEVLMAVRVVCQTHGLQLAQTWIPCIQQGKSGTRHSDENYKECVSTVDDACHINDPSLSGFHKACSEHHLLKGQGIVGKAFTTNQPCFSSDITAFSKTEYPLSHHAKIFGLRAAVAIRLRSVHTGKFDFVLEFFLPKDCLTSEKQKTMLKSLSTSLQQVCQSLRVVTSKELEDEMVLQVPSQLPFSESCGVRIDGDNGRQEGIKVLFTPNVEFSRSNTSKVINNIESENRTLSSVSTVQSDGQVPQERSRTRWDSYGIELPEELNSKAPCCQVSLKCINKSANTYIGRPSFSTRCKVVDRKKAKAEKHITLQLLRRYFAGSLKDAAKSLGVCPTTLKRVCRQHGITRWPSRKIKKVGHCLRKLQVVIDSVPGVDGTLQLSYLYDDFPKSCSSDLDIQMISEKGPICKTEEDNCMKSVKSANCLLTSHASASTSLSCSCSQASGSSNSSGVKQDRNAPVHPMKDVSIEKSQNIIFKRVSSELTLQPSSLETFGNLAGSQSLKPLGEASPCQNRGIGDKLRGKAMYGEEKIRFSIQLEWGIQELKQEIAKRFGISNINLVDLKYLDDANEWVLLTCDSDLKECTDLYRSSHKYTVKILVRHTSLPTATSSGREL